MGKKSIMMYDGKVWGYEVSEYGLKKGYLDYYTLGKMVGDAIHNDIIRAETMDDYWEIVNGEFDNEITQEYIISENGYNVLKDYTDELVLYNERLDIYIWAVDHIGTSWKYVLTDIELIEEEDL